MVTGYFQSKSKFKQKKVWSLLVSSLFYRVIITIILVFLGIISISKLRLLKEFFPIDLTDYWFIKTYIALYLVSPFLNKLIEILKKEDYRKLLAILFVILSVIPYITGNEGFDNTGATFIHFIFLYFIGGYLRKYPISQNTIFKRYSKQFHQLIFVGVFVGCVLLNYVIYNCATFLMGTNTIVDEIAGDLICMTIQNSNPIVLVQTVSFFLFFQTLDIHSKMINNLAKLTLGIYLIHDNTFLRHLIYVWLRIDNGPVSNYSFILYIFVIAFMIYVVCSIIEWSRQKIFKFIYNRKISVKIRKKYYNWFNNLWEIREVS